MAGAVSAKSVALLAAVILALVAAAAAVRLREEDVVLGSLAPALAPAPAPAMLSAAGVVAPVAWAAVAVVVSLLAFLAH